MDRAAGAAGWRIDTSMGNPGVDLWGIKVECAGGVCLCVFYVVFLCVLGVRAASSLVVTVDCRLESMHATQQFTYLFIPTTPYQSSKPEPPRVTPRARVLINGIEFWRSSRVLNPPTNCVVTLGYFQVLVLLRAA